jgi:formylglycine-generating enzyme required for sulfatase activity
VPDLGCGLETRAQVPLLRCLALCGALLASATSPADTITFSPATFEAGERASWQPLHPESIDMTDEFISPPRPGQDREAWLRAVREYRAVIRGQGQRAVLNLNFDGLRSWTRLTLEATESLGLAPGAVLQARVEARWREGRGALCAAYDYVDSDTGAWVGWSGVLASMEIPQDGRWHEQVLLVEAPDAVPPGTMLRPIFGMDATFGNTPGVVEIRNLQVGAPGTPPHVDIQPLDRSLYDRADLAWAQEIFTCHFTFMYDRSFYDPERGYLVESFLEDGRRAFGGYDAVVLWQGYPRLGFDDRNQFDMYRDMPGGVEALRKVVDQFHGQGVKVFVDYTPWDTGTRRSGSQTDDELLAGLVGDIDADGVFLDTLSAASPSLRAQVDRVRPGVVIAPEIHPPINQLSVLSLSWGQWMKDPRPPGMFHLKWIEPRHLQHQVRRWNKSHQDEIEAAFFNGSGMLVWENVFGSYNPWSAEDRALWRRCIPILRAFQPHFVSDAWDPFYPTLQEGLHAHRWPGNAAAGWEAPVVFTLRREGAAGVDRETAVLEVPARALEGRVVALDLWRRVPARVEVAGAVARIFAGVETLGAVALVREDDPRVAQFQQVAAQAAPDQDRTRDPLPLAVSNSNALTEVSAVRTNTGEGMLLVPGGSVRMRLSHKARECGCVPDPQTPVALREQFLTGEHFEREVAHDFVTEVGTFHIDEAEVSNAEYKVFLEASGYRPQHAHNFLKHWPDGVMPEALADHPVVYVDPDDARAYAAWAGKRLPTEAEWHLAASGVENYPWPWGNDFDPARVNTSGATMPVRSLPEGRSPIGCHHMAGNVWEWTEPTYDDGHTRFTLLRGGSFYRAEGSDWYAPGGPQPNTAHAKFILMWPSLDRCATIGFRCVSKP